MIVSPESRDLARRLLACEGEAAEPTESLPLRVYEKLRSRLCALAGVAGFQSLASRALTLAKSDVPELSDLRVTADGSLKGFGEPGLTIHMDADQAREGETILIAQLLGLLLIFLGEALTLNLICDLWPNADLGDRISGNGRIT